MKKNNKIKKNGFTLVELLAVIVILAIILVIAVPKVMSIIEDAKMGTLESTAKMIASAAEKQKVQNTVLGNTEEITCDSVAKINKGDYASCDITFEDNTAKVTIEGSGKFDGLYVCDGTKTDAVASAEECNVVIDYTDVACFTYEENDEYQGIEITGYDFDCGPEVSIPEKINNTPVVKIGNEAFNAYIEEEPSPESNDNLEYNITTLEGKLTNGKINSLGYTYGDEEITKVMLPNTIKEIGSSAFRENNITELDLSKLTQLTQIGDYAFSGNSITKLDLSKLTQLTKIGDKAFLDNEITNLKLSTSIEQIGRTAFSGNNITELDLSKLTQLTQIGDYAFSGNSITKLDLSKLTQLTKIGDKAFYDNSISSELILTGSVEYIGKEAFSYNLLTKINLQNLEAEIGYCAFGMVADTDIHHNLPDTYDCYEE